MTAAGRICSNATTRRCELARQDHWHPVVHRRHDVVRPLVTNRAALDPLFCLLVDSARPQAGEGERLSVCKLEVDRVLLAYRAEAPFVEDVGDD